MSSQLDVSIRNKKTNETVNLFWFSTTPARQLYSVLNTTFEKKKGKEDSLWDLELVPKPLDDSLIQEVLDFYDEEIKSDKNYIEQCISNNERLENRIRNINNKDYKEMYDRIEEDIFSNEQAIKEMNEDIEELKFHKAHFEFARKVLESNTYNKDKEYELVYTLD